MLISLTVRVSAPPPLLRRQEEKYEPPQVPLESMTYYSQEFTAKQPLPGLPIAINKRETLRVPTMPIETRTTNKLCECGCISVLFHFIQYLMTAFLFL